MGPDAKGRELENAVRAIESVILQSSPTLRDKAFAIEARKRITVGGVHHEVDIFVTVEVAKGYTSNLCFRVQELGRRGGQEHVAPANGRETRNTDMLR